MPVKMSEHQLRFWQELLSPFPGEVLSTTSRGGRELTYVDKRAITNRLDSVCGPDGWYPEYEATARGYKCRLHILVPCRSEGTSVWMHKEDGAGFEEMGSYNKKTNEWEADVDNDEKSGYTNALRRAAQDAWGIGRYLYGKGIPSFLDPNASPAEYGYGPPENAVAAAQAPRPAPSPAPAPAQAPAPTPAKPPFDNFKIPPAGRQVYPWMKEMEKAFETSLFNGMREEGEKNGWGKQFDQWTQEQVNAICMGAIRFVRELPSYKGQFEYLFPGGASEQPTLPSAAPVPGVNIADVRRTLIDKMNALVLKQLGRKPTNEELKSAFEGIASCSKNGEGHTGEVPESLARLTDLKWIQNMIAFTEGQIAQAAALPEGEEIPF